MSEEKKQIFFDDSEEEDFYSFFTEPDHILRIKQWLSLFEGKSPYLTRLFFTEKEILKDVLEKGYDKAFSNLMKSSFSLLYLNSQQSDVEKGLRLLKRRTALLVALADLEGDWDLTHATRALSIMAEACLRIAVSFVLRKAHEKKEINLPDIENPENGSGYILIAMGKLGARELNYSSDIDLIVLYDEERAPYTGKKEVSSFFVKLTRDVISMMEDRTVDGYVFRTDLRLRPDPGSTPVALSTVAAVCYYESFAQNWERAAFIKARTVAGDKKAGDEFLKEIRPFIWRRSSDFYVLKQIHEIKRSSGVRSAEKPPLPGHNIKLGQGGIREIEFFTQLQQLLWGGRNARLRQRGTLNALIALEKAGWVSQEDKENLSKAYTFLRTLEHRLQMVADEQTQTLPKNVSELRSLSDFMGFASYDAFEEALNNTLKTVEKAYDALFANEEGNSEDNFSFNGTEIPEETAEKLRQMGFLNMEYIGDAVRGWLSGRYRSVRNEKARALMADLLPFIFKALSRTENADRAFMRFDEFLKGLPAGVQLFSLFQSRPALLELLAEVMGSSPRLSSELAHRPELFDTVLNPAFFRPFPDVDSLTSELVEVISQTDGLEQILESIRRFVREKRFQCGVQFLRGLINGQETGKCLSNLVTAALSVLCPAVRTDYEKQYGRIPQGVFSFLLLGKVGSGEMTFLSDLDILFIYDAREGAVSEGGKSSLSAGMYYSRFAQRLINAITVNTREGVLWPVDMRLRPSGSSGPAAVSFESFKRYYEESAWTWEYMAMTKARIVWGENKKVQHELEHVLTLAKDTEKVRIDVLEMRNRINAEKPAKSIWDIKKIPGGMLDIEFSIQLLQLLHGQAHPELMLKSVLAVTDKAVSMQILDGQTGKALSDAYRFWQELSILFSLCSEDGTFDSSTAPEEMRKKLCAFCGLQSIEDVEKKIKTTAEKAALYRLF